MKFLLDHDVPDRIADVLLAAGHECVRLREVLPKESADSDVLSHATANRLLLVTCNRDDFLVLSGARSHAGIIVLIRRDSRVAECAALLRLLDKAGESGLAGKFNFA